MNEQLLTDIEARYSGNADFWTDAGANNEMRIVTEIESLRERYTTELSALQYVEDQIEDLIFDDREAAKFESDRALLLRINTRICEIQFEKEIA